jgi:hypothetical protein
MSIALDSICHARAALDGTMDDSSGWQLFGKTLSS